MRRNRRRSRLRRVVVVVVTASSNAFRAVRTTPKRTQLRRHAAAVGKYGQHGAEVTGKVAFQGEHGAYSEEAVFQHFGDAVATLKGGDDPADWDFDFSATSGKFVAVFASDEAA